MMAFVIFWRRTLTILSDVLRAWQKHESLSPRGSGRMRLRIWYWGDLSASSITLVRLSFRFCRRLHAHSLRVKTLVVGQYCKPCSTKSGSLMRALFWRPSGSYGGRSAAAVELHGDHEQKWRDGSGRCRTRAASASLDGAFKRRGTNECVYRCRAAIAGCGARECRDDD